MRKPSDRQILGDVGARVAAARCKAGLTQEDAAHRARIDYKRWQRLEAGKVNATIRTLARVARALGTDFWRLVGSR